MRAYDLSPLTSPLDKISTKAMSMKIRTTGIGDGGNEIGMGKVFDLVKKYIKNGEKIATTAIMDNLIVASVSNWGGYALSIAILAVCFDNKNV